MLEELRKELSPISHNIWAVGSRETCNPAPTDTDFDVLVYLKRRNAGDIGRLGFNLSSPSDHYAPEDNAFNSWRRGEVNLIASSDFSFIRKFLAATAIAKRLNLLKKEDRVALFQAVLYGNGAEFDDWSILGIDFNHSPSNAS